LLPLKASGPIDVTVDGILAVPVQVEPALTTLSVIVNVPPPEQPVVVAHAGEAGTPAVTPATTANTITARTVDANRRGDALTLATTLRRWPRKDGMSSSSGLSSGARCATQGSDEQPEDFLKVSRRQAERRSCPNRRIRAF
jgi:hypothetical protein